ncbi:MAG: FAD-dependent oxidoreductase [Candidatus Omnitrophica bacterium]|nr:FAD-dependent oxidoreductase [Candidatus Omnitrophota bacterium]
MQIYQAQLIQRIKRTPTVKSFRFRLEKKIDFIPGQFLKIIFDEKDINNKDLNKYLSFSCSPGLDYIEVTKRLSQSIFSQRLKDLSYNQFISIQAPLGTCVFRDEYKKVAFLIGGIGITPVISIIEYIVIKNIDCDVYLFYSNRNEEEIAFKQELDNWRTGNKNIKIIYTVTDAKPVNPDCRFCRIDKELLMDNLADINERIFFIFGPPKMVEAMKVLVEDLGCPKDNLKTESFLGY